MLSRLIMQNCLNSLFGQIGRKLKAEGAAGQSLCRASVLLRNQRRHHAAFGVSLPPAPDCGSFVVLNGPALLKEGPGFQLSRALKRRLGECASPEGLIASFRTRALAEPVL